VSALSIPHYTSTHGHCSPPYPTSLDPSCPGHIPRMARTLTRPRACPRPPTPRRSLTLVRRRSGNSPSFIPSISRGGVDPTRRPVCICYMTCKRRARGKSRSFILFISGGGMDPTCRPIPAYPCLLWRVN